METIPNYVLYGENENEIFPDYLHIESIRSRSIHNSWHFKPHQHHNLHQFFYILKGGGTVLIDKIDYELNDNQVISIPPLTIHGFQFAPDTEGWVLTLPQQSLQNIISEIAFLIKPISQTLIHNCTNDHIQKEFIYIFKSISEIHSQSQPIRDFKLQCYTNLLISKVAEMFPYAAEMNQNIPDQKQNLVQELQNKINENYKQRLSVAQYADSLKITATHLNRVCRSVLNISPSDLINERSILEAKRLLSYTAMSISEISYELGFCDAAHFSKFFLTHAHQKPSDFRKKLLAKS